MTQLVSGAPAHHLRADLADTLERLRAGPLTAAQIPTWSVLELRAAGYAISATAGPPCVYRLVAR